MQNIITQTYAWGLLFDKPALDLNSGIRTLFDLSSVFADGFAMEFNNIVGYSFYIESLIAQVKIISLATAQIPNISPEYSSAEKFLEIERVLTNYPLIELNIWIDYDGQGWELEAAIPIQNRKNQYYPLPLLKPYLTLGDIKPLPKTAKVGFSLTDKGWGLMGNGDRIRIHCDGRKEISLTPKAAENIGETISYERIFPVNQSATRISPYRPSRKSIFIRNSGDTKLFFHFGYDSALELLELGKKPFLLPGEAWSWENSYFVLPHDLWAEAVSDNTEDVGRLTVFEAF